MKFQINGKNLTFFLPKKISHNLFKEVDVNEFACEILFLDFRETSFITLPGAMYLICVGGYFSTRKKNIFKGCEIINISDRIIDVLTEFGFFEHMQVQSKLIINREIISEERKKRLIRNANRHSSISNQIVMPLEIIQIGNAAYYETYVSRFFNLFHDFYISLSTIPELDFFYDHTSNYQIDYSEVSNAIFEMIKNIYDHSNSWGIGGIYASKKIGTQITFYDIGIGIFNSVNKYHVFEDEKDALFWALTDGNSSKPESNQGHGFTVMRDIAEKKNGTLSIRSGKYHIYNKQNKLVINPTSWFPGTQIVIFIPSKP